MSHTIDFSAKYRGIPDDHIDKLRESNTSTFKNRFFSNCKNYICKYEKIDTVSGIVRDLNHYDVIAKINDTVKNADNYSVPRTLNYLDSIISHCKNKKRELEIDSINIFRKHRRHVFVIVDPEVDMIMDIDMEIENPDNLRVQDIIVSVNILIGGSETSRICDMTHHHFLGDRKIKFDNNKIIFPLTSFDDMIPLCYIKYNVVRIEVVFKNACLYSDVSFYCNKYTLHECDRNIEHRNIAFSHIMSQYHDYETDLVQGINNLKLYFCHPVYLLYFYGLDKAKIKNIKLIFDDDVYYDGNVETLEDIKRKNNIIFEPIVIFFSETIKLNHEFWQNSTINFSRINKTRLIIDTNEIESNIRIVALNLNTYNIFSEMFGVCYSH